MRPRKKNRHLPACVFLSHGKYYYVKNNKWHPLGKDLTEALDAYANLVSPKTGGMVELIDKALPHILRRKSGNTVKQYVKIARRLKIIFAEFDPQQVRPSDIAEVKTAYSDKPNMGNRILSFTRMVFDFALEHRLVDYNPALGIKPHREEKRTRLITREEFNLIRQNASPRLQLIMDVQDLTGQRIGDVLKIKRSDLLSDGIGFTQQKTGAKITVKWSQALRECVIRASEVCGEGLYLFSNRNGKSPDYRTTHIQWTRACKKAGVKDARPNDLRAMSLTETDHQGKDATGLGGHTTKAMTKRYLRNRKPKLVEGPDRLK